jgi:hypothetical protein
MLLLGDSKDEIFVKYQKNITNSIMQFICAVFDQAKFCLTIKDLKKVHDECQILNSQVIILLHTSASDVLGKFQSRKLHDSNFLLGTIQRVRVVCSS